jgi:hypothetical protein
LINRSLSYISHHAIAILALVCSLLALAGASYAATQLPKNSVGNPQIKRGAVAPPKFSKEISGYVRMYAKISGAGKLQYARPVARLTHWTSAGNLTSAIVKWKQTASRKRCSVMVAPQLAYPPQLADGEFIGGRHGTSVEAIENGQGAISITVVC